MVPAARAMKTNERKESLLNIDARCATIAGSTQSWIDLSLDDMNENIEPPKRWVRQFETFPLDVIVPSVYELIFKGFVSSKNLQRLKSIGASLKNLQPSHSMTLSSPGSNED